MIMLSLWLAAGFLGGLVLYLAAPWACAQIAGGEYPEKVGNAYAWLAMTAATRGAFVCRDHGGLDFVSPGFEAPKKADKANVGGEKGHHKDDIGIMSRLANKPFALGLEALPTYITPLHAEIGDVAKEKKDNGELGRASEDVMIGGVPLPKTSQLVRISDAKHIITGDADRDDGENAYSFGVKSQEGFNERVSFGQAMIIVLSLLGSAVTFYFLADHSGGGGTTVSLLALLSSTTAANKENLRLVGAVGVPALFVLVVAVFSFLELGLVGALLVLLVMFGVATGPPLAIALLGPGIPNFLGPGLARLHWILAQLSMWRGVFVRMDTGEYRYRRLRDGDERDDVASRYYIKFKDGEIEPVDGTPGDLYRMGWRPLGITEQKSERNVGDIKLDIPKDVETDEYGAISRTQRQGFAERFPTPTLNEWTISMPMVWSEVYPSSESHLVERGLLQALEEHGGKQQIGFIVLIIGTVVAGVIGSLMGFMAGGGFA